MVKEAIEESGEPAYLFINDENDRYEYETLIEIEGQFEPIHGGKIKKHIQD
jgi:hypothetical protein